MTVQPTFFVAEISALTPGSTTLTVSEGHGTTPHGTLAPFPDQLESTATIRVSDLGYRTRSTDPDGVQVYPPLLDQAFAIDRTLNLDPSQSPVAAAWGAINLADPGGQFDALAAAWNVDGRDVRILCGQKAWDPGRGYLTDPAYAALAPAFIGFATPWFLTDTELQIPVRDATYWIEQPLQANLYAGTGTYEGTADLGGTPKPKTRGGVSSAPVPNVTPVLIDPVNRIYQYNDGPGTIVNLYEGGDTTIALASNTTNLYAGTTPPGQYRTDNSRGIFQLGSAPARAITVDVTGEFPVAGAVTTAAAIALYLLTEDLAVPAANVDAASFGFTPLSGDPAAAYAGAYFAPSDNTDGVAALGYILTSFGGQIVPMRDGTLRLLLLRALDESAMPVATLGLVNAVSVTPQPLPAAVAPPPFRYRVGYSHNYTVQTSDVAPNTADAHRQFIAAADRYASFSSSDILLAYRRPNDSKPIGGALALLADAQATANNLGALWSTRRRLYNVVVPVSIGLTFELGDVVNLVWPMDDLSNGRLGQIVGEQFKSTDPTITFRVLV